MKKNKEVLKEIPEKNYMKVLAIFFTTIIVVITMFITYKQHKNYENNIPILRGEISEIKEIDIETYFSENDDFFLYVGVANNENCREIEPDLIKTLKKRKINNIVYLNITDIKDKEKFYNDFNSNYSNGIKLDSYPAFAIIKDGKIVDLIKREDRKMNIGDIEQFLDITGYEVIK